MKFMLACAAAISLALGFQAPSGKATDAEAALREMGITLPTPAKPMANYVPAVRTGNLVFLAGAGPRKDDGTYVAGKIGQKLTVEDGYEASRLTALTQLAALKAEIGDLNKVKRVVK